MAATASCVATPSTVRCFPAVPEPAAEEEDEEPDWPETPSALAMATARGSDMLTPGREGAPRIENRFAARDDPGSPAAAAPLTIALPEVVSPADFASSSTTCMPFPVRTLFTPLRKELADSAVVASRFSCSPEEVARVTQHFALAPAAAGSVSTAVCLPVQQKQQ